MTRLSRRAFLASSVALAGGLTGCSGLGSTGPTGEGSADGSDGSSGGTNSNGGTGSTDGTGTAAGDLLPAPVAGDPDADVTVTAWEDYACPHCQTYSTTVYPKVKSDYLDSGSIRYEFHDFPVMDSQVTWQAANAARAVQVEAGDEAYFTYSKRLYENQRRLGPDVYAELTDGLDAGGDAVRQAATNRTYDPTIKADRQAAIDKGLRGTPAVIVDGNEVAWENEIAYAPVRDAIESALNG